jgi:hypothetical protein
LFEDGSLTSHLVFELYNFVIMGLLRRHKRAPVGHMHKLRTGGKVSLFNYNPSIAGGKIMTKRFSRRHRLGMIGRGWQEKQLAQFTGAQGQGLTAPGSHARMGMGTAPAHAQKEGRKRILDAMNAQFAKRARV